MISEQQIVAWKFFPHLLPPYQILAVMAVLEAKCK